MGNADPAPPIIQLTGVSKHFGDFQALRDISLSVSLGERVVVCGPSGSGKSTMIRCINRLETHEQGTIVVDGMELSADMDDVMAVRREVGMVFQQFNLFPHLTVLDNLTPGTAPRAQDAEGGGDQAGDGVSRAGEDPRTSEQIPVTALRRTTATRGHRAQPVHETAHHAVRRADLGPRPPR